MPRLLARHSEHGYTANAWLAMPEEPEAVSAGDQQALTDLARRRERERRLDAYREARHAIDAALSGLLSAIGGTPSHGLAQGVRAVQRSAEALGRRL